MQLALGLLEVLLAVRAWRDASSSLHRVKVAEVLAVAALAHDAAVAWNEVRLLRRRRRGGVMLLVQRKSAMLLIL